MTTTRDDAVRTMLVDHVNTTRRRRWVLPVVGIGAFALAGALTAGAIVSSGLLQQQGDEHDAAALVNTGEAGDVTFLADPVTRTSDTDTSITLGARPTAAAQIAVGAECPPPRTVAITVGGTQIATIECGAPGTLVTVSGTAAPTLAMSPSDTGGYTVWVAWAKPDPLPGPSAQQQAALADGIVTRSEYLAAWNRYLGCMRALGQPIDASTQTQMYVATGFVSDQYQADARCEASEFTEVDTAWQIEHPEPTPGDAAWGASQYDPAKDDPRYAG